ncbi:hypothetical protein GOODEAATRI_010477 [Goodea atripinnis]|uniref:Translation elongation factor EF1B beta/delta subunit guanine nucleotide exchange domain-containing protein n=1 Tax=Goodea atripinnis TaxID=208336 RepID=A0ABV0N0I6_9TELE
MAKLEECVRSVQADGLLWGTSKLVPVGYGIKKLQIACVVEDDKVGTDLLEEEITKFEDYPSAAVMWPKYQVSQLEVPAVESFNTCLFFSRFRSKVWMLFLSSVSLAQNVLTAWPSQDSIGHLMQYLLPHEKLLTDSC